MFDDTTLLPPYPQLTTKERKRLRREKRKKDRWQIEEAIKTPFNMCYIPTEEIISGGYIK